MVLKFGFFTATVNGGKNFELVGVSSVLVYEVSITAVAVAALPNRIIEHILFTHRVL